MKILPDLTRAGRRLWTLCLAGLLLGSLPATAQERVLNFITAPTHSEEITRRAYQPLIDYLSRQIGQPIEFEVARNFIEYNNNTLKDAYDIVFDGPHYVGWRMQRFDHTPIARLPGQIRIVVVSHEARGINQLEELAGRRVCAFPSPNMLTMAFLGEFTNPMRQPMLTPCKGFSGLRDCINRDDIFAGVLRDGMWNNMDQTGLRVIYQQEQGYPERTFAVSTRVDAQTREKLRQALTSEEAQQHGAQVLEMFNRKNFIDVKPEEYQGLGRLMNPIWGFEL